MKTLLKIALSSVLLVGLTACNSDNQIIAPANASPTESESILASGKIFNPEAVIPPQCYTKTNGVNNPCYVCHQTYDAKLERPNFMHDGSLQGNYEFSDVGATNSWTNLFKDRTQMIAAISDTAIMEYVNQDNYTPFIEALKQDKNWTGVIPEIKDLEKGAVAFDKHGVAKDGSHWVAFNYKPFPSTFWPTNGSTGDVMIRLPKAFREMKGQYSQDVYFTNLALLEITLKDLTQVTLPAVNEQNVGLDIDGNGLLGNTELVKVRSHYVGDASDIKLGKMLYPKGIEFLHTVRYLGIEGEDTIVLPARMKEVRYMKKYRYREPSSLKSAYYRERKEKHFENLPITANAGDKGIGNGFGWAIQGFVEDKQGRLRKQEHEELSFCNGCHKSIGSTSDQVFSFPRKVEGKNGWGYIDLTKMTDVANIGENQGEYLTYMQRVGGGDEFRQNQEMLERWFNKDGTVNIDKVKALDSIYPLITPSKTRAIALNKAYKTIVDEQSFIFGRDATIKPARSVLQIVDESVAPLQVEHRFEWDMRLNWQD